MKFKTILISVLCAMLVGCGNAENIKTAHKEKTAESVSEKTSEENKNVQETTMNEKNILIAYFTLPETEDTDTNAGASRVIYNNELYGNIEFMANVIEQTIGGDKFEIKTIQEYPTIHKPLVDFADKELDNNERPELSMHIEDFDKYDTIFIGYPIWWGDMPMPLYSLFEEYDFKGKTIIPFSSHGGSLLAGTVSSIEELEPEANVIENAFTVSRDDIADNVGNVAEDIKSWVNSLDLRN